MLTINYRKELFKFLKKNDLYDKWLNNLKTQHPISSSEERHWDKMYKRLYENKSFEAINYAFCWRYTEEGHEFWEGKNEKWKRKVIALEEYQKCKKYSTMTRLTR